MSLLMRRRMMMQARVECLDTTPIILDYGRRLNRGEGYYIESLSNICTTDYYNIEPSDSVQYITYKLNSITDSYLNYHCYKDGVYIDYWSERSVGDAIITDSKVSAGANQLRFTLFVDKIDDSFCYVNNTGKILFAGKNTEYYGKRTIYD